MVLALTVLVFGAAVAAITLQLRAGLREQILRREAVWLEAIASMQLQEAAETLGEQSIEKVPGAVFVAMLKTQRLAGVTGLRVYDADRQQRESWMMLSDPKNAAPAQLWSRLSTDGATGRLHTRLSATEAEEFVAIDRPESMLEAWVPLRLKGAKQLLGAAQFWRDGADLAAELGAHDRRLWLQAAVAWLLGSAVIVTAVGWALRRLNEANCELRIRSDDLLRANRELVLAAKTSALGAVTAHLMHELKNPIAGLEVIVAGQGDTARADAGGGELAAASELTRRLRTMVNDVVGVLRDEQSSAAFELTCADIAESAANKVRGEAERRGVTLTAAGTESVALAARRANLVTLVLRNLLQNALEATPAGGSVRLSGSPAEGGGAQFLVEDSGGGIPDSVRTRLFQPCASTKVGGSGLGLALSQQLAQQAGGRIDLQRSDTTGTCFRLVLRPDA
jgi:signal transduction histidine kinase